jgi:hypothetical protein
MEANIHRVLPLASGGGSTVRFKRSPFLLKAIFENEFIKIKEIAINAESQAF